MIKSLAFFVTPLFASISLLNYNLLHFSSPDPLPSPLDTTEVQIDLDSAIAITIPAGSGELEPVSFRTIDGREGWAIQIPGSRPIATPAYADGLLFVGGGYGSYEFYAINANTGKVAWKIKTADDGPSAAVEEDGYVAFNTESCTVIVVEAKTGKIVWQEWLGDPLMSQPAISDGKLYIAYPGGGRGGQHQQRILPHGADPGEPLTVEGEGTHRMLCADLKTGKHIWEYAISADVISAPVLDSNRVVFTCFDGTSYSLDAVTGKLNWREENAGTSAPIIADGRVIFTAKDEENGNTYEGLKRSSASSGTELHTGVLARGDAEHLKENGGGGVAIDAQTQSVLDQSVGFASAPAAAQLDRANRHLGVSTVAGGWAYQGARAAYSRGQIMNAQGLFLNSVDADDGDVAWRAKAKGKGILDQMQLFLPPAVGGDNLYLCTTQGHLASVRHDDGRTRFIYRIDHPIAFQPALAEGNIYTGTTDGWLVCLKLDEKDADGWYAWGGNAQHNKKE